MADIDLRRAERAFVENNNYSNYCRYVRELQRHSGLPHFDPSGGVARGWFPAALHLFAPWNCRWVPRYWSSNRLAADPQCLPSTGILGHILYAFFMHLVTLSPRRCTCGGGERGHSPICEFVTGTGDFSEEFHAVMREWFATGHGPSMLDLFLEEGLLGVFESMIEGEYNIQDLINVINARLGWYYTFTWQISPPSALEWRGIIPQTDVVRFDFILQDWGPATLFSGVHENPWSYFAFHLSTEHQVEIEWKVRPEATDLTHFGWQYTGAGVGISTTLAQRISDIPRLLLEYPVWFWPA